MDFFRSQDEARRRSRWLLVGFAVAVLLEVVAVYAIVHLVFGPGPGAPVDPRLLGLVTVATVGAILAASSWRAGRLRQGGPAVAAVLGARRVPPDTDQLDERRLHNVVEEMAIAAGIPVPAVFVLDRESGINAFAAGHTPADAAVAVTAGALIRLDRDELRAMVAHEAAHILNGDMRVNTRLVGLLYGLLLPGVVGRGMLASRLGGASRAARPGWTVAGTLLVVVGELGVILGRLVQGGVSRQRELLADAAAVQFTRDPAALAGVLRKIGGLAFGSRVTHPHAAELAHLFLGEGLRPPFLFPVRTHPPLTERIQRLDPSFDGVFETTRTPARPRLVDQVPAREGGARREAGDGMVAAIERLGVAALLASIGDPGAGHIDHAAWFLAGLPPELREAAHDHVGARAVVLALLLSSEPSLADDQRKVASVYDTTIADRAVQLAPSIRAQGPASRVPLLELALPALGGLSDAEARRFRRVALEVIRASGHARIFDLAVMRVLARQLDGDHGGVAAGPGGVPSLNPVREEVELLLSAVARAGGEGEETAVLQFAAGARCLPRDLALKLLPSERTRIADVDGALLRLEAVAPVLRRRLLEACIAAIIADGLMAAGEVEMIRAAAAALDLPMPPILLSGDMTLQPS